MRNPLISVILPVYNCEKYIEESVRSILDQTVDDFELIVIDDGSTDESMKIVSALAFEDNRIRVLKNDTNIGLIYTLNRGLQEATGDFIARMDADDRSHIDRFEKQLLYLDMNPNVYLCSCKVRYFGGKSEVIEYNYTPAQTKVELLYHNGVNHPGYMMRSALIKEEHRTYNPKYLHAEDYEFVVNVSRSHEVGIVPEVLLDYRIHENQVSGVNAKISDATKTKIKKEQLEYLAVHFSKEEEADFFDSDYGENQKIKSVEDLKRRLNTFTRMIDANDVNRVYDSICFKAALAERFAYSVCRISKFTDVNKKIKISEVADAFMMNESDYKKIFDRVKKENIRGLLRRMI